MTLKHKSHKDSSLWVLNRSYKVLSLRGEVKTQIMTRNKRMLRCLRSKVRMTVSWVVEVYTHLKFLYVKEKQRNLCFSPLLSYLKRTVMVTMPDKCLFGIERAGLGLQLSAAWHV